MKGTPSTGNTATFGIVVQPSPTRNVVAAVALRIIQLRRDSLSSGSSINGRSDTGIYGRNVIASRAICLRAALRQGSRRAYGRRDYLCHRAAGSALALTFSPR